MKRLKSRFLGSVLLVSGTTVGAGMLALPVVSSFAGFFPSLILLFLCWGFFFATALFFLDVSLASKPGANLITMAGDTLGRTGRAVCWIVYLLLLYSLTAAYIAGSSPMIMKGLSLLGVDWPEWSGPFLLLIIFGFFVYIGTKSVDYVNRLLMIGLCIVYLTLVSLLPRHVHTSLLNHIDFSSLCIAVPIFFTSFGFHIIIPSLVTYLNRDVKQLRRSLFVGSLVPLVVYAIWELLVLGIIPITGEISFFNAWNLGEPSSAPLSQLLQHPSIRLLANAFSFFAIITSFLGVSLSLSDFLGDGLKMHRFTWGREIACLLTFVPPLLFVLAYQRGFILALEYAGLLVAILLGIIPAMMAWSLPAYRSRWRKIVLGGVICGSLFVIGLDLLDRFDVVDILASYRNV